MTRLSLTQVRRVFGTQPAVVAVDEATLEIAEGDFVALEGPSGSGKSTLLNLIALLDRPTSGHYSIDGRDAAELSDRDRARLRSDTFGFVFQSFHLMDHRSVADNVELGLLYRGVPKRQRRLASSARLDEVGLAHRQDFTTRTLSGGERQRVAIARATVGNPPVIVADEPTGNLDSANGRTTISYLADRHAEGTSIVLVTHDANVAAHADRRLSVRDGVVTEEAHGLAVEFEVEETDRSPSRQRAQVPGTASRLRVVDLLRESAYALAARPGRSALLVSAIAIAVALVVVTFGLSQTSAAQVQSSFDVARNRQVTLDLPAAWPNGDPRPVIAADFSRDLAQVSGIDHAGLVQAYEPVSANAIGRPAIAAAAVYGVSSDLADAVSARIRWVPNHAHRLGYHEAVVGTYSAADLELGPLELRPTVVVAGVDYRVVGVMEGSAQVPSLLGGVLVDWRHGDQVGRVATSTMYLQTRSGAAQQVARYAPIALNPELTDLIAARAPADPSTLRDSVQGDVRAALLALSAVAVLASIISVANAMLLSVLERVGELGLRRAIGARGVHVLAHTGCEAAMAGLLGGVVGLFLGVVAILSVTLARHWQPVIDARVLPVAFLGGMLVGIIGGLPASVRASRITPGDALRR